MGPPLEWFPPLSNPQNWQRRSIRWQERQILSFPWVLGISDDLGMLFIIGIWIFHLYASRSGPYPCPLLFSTLQTSLNIVSQISARAVISLVLYYMPLGFSWRLGRIFKNTSSEVATRNPISAILGFSHGVGIPIILVRSLYILVCYLASLSFAKIANY